MRRICKTSITQGANRLTLNGDVPSMAYEVLRLKRDGKIGYITLNRPERLNALNNQLVDEIHVALDELGEDDDIGAIIITGEGRGFCSGADQSGRYGPKASSSIPLPRPPRTK